MGFFEHLECAPSADDALMALRALARAYREDDEPCEPDVGAIVARDAAEEIRLPADLSTDQFLGWVRESLVTEEGILDEGIPRDLRGLVHRAVEHVLDGFLPSPCIRLSGEEAAPYLKASPRDIPFVFFGRY
jgi:hypothetical protein